MGVGSRRNHAGSGESAVAHDVHRPAAGVLATSRDDLWAAGQGRESLGAGGGPDERRQPVTVDAGLLEALALGQSTSSAVDRLDDLVGAAQQGVAQLAHDGGVGRFRR